MDNTQQEALIAQITKQSATSVEQAITEIEDLARSVDAVNLFSAMVANLAFAPEGSASEATHGDVPAKIESLAYYLYPFFGVSKNSEITPWHVKQCIESLNSLVTMGLISSAFTEKSKGQVNGVDHVVTDARMNAEIVRGSAYPEQTGMEIAEIQGRFDSWFAWKVGVSPTRAKAILWAIIRHEEDALNSAKPNIRAKVEAARKRWRAIKKKPASQRNGDEARDLEVFKSEEVAGIFEGVMSLNLVAPQVIPVGQSDLSDLEPPPTLEEWDGLIRLIGMTGEDRSRMSARVDVRQRPLFVLPDRRAILVDISNGLDTLWEAFERAAKADQVFFDQKYQPRKAGWLEDRVITCLSNIFQSHSIYQNLTYPDPDKTDGSTTELDAAVLWGPFLVLVESKAKQFRLESQLGDVGRLRSDIKANVEDAFDQARRAARHVHNTDAPVFLEKSSGRQLAVQKDSIRRIYLVTVSQHLLASLATRPSMFQGLGLFREGEYPLSISIADLETVTQFCDGPDVLLHYIEKRLLTQKESLDIQADELDLLGAYLQTRLQPSRLWDRDEVKPTGVSLVGYSAQFDDWYSYKRGDLSAPPKIGLEIPVEIKNILSELRKRNDDAARWIAFALLDLSDRTLAVIAKGFADLKTAKFTSGMFRTLIYTEGDTVISIVASPDGPHDPLSVRTQMRATIEKYRHKAEKCVAFGVTPQNHSQLFEYVFWLEGTWQHDAEMEEMIANEPPFLPPPGTKLPGRNEPCWCGSGRKFKKCCLPRFESGRRKSPSSSA